jgi:hypothetical protein
MDLSFSIHAMISMRLLVAAEDEQEKLRRNVFCIEEVVKKLDFPHPAENCKYFVNFVNFQEDRGVGGRGVKLSFSFPLSMTQ